jgi:hypothetical protein
VARSFLIASFLLIAGSLLGREGFIRTRTGTIYEGHIRFEAGNVVVVNAAREVRETIPLTNVVSINLAAEAPGPSPLALPDGTLPPSWKSVDVGSVAEAGQVDVRSGGFSIRSAGTNLFGSNDSFHFVYRPVQGDSHLLCRVVEVEDSHPLTQVGLTIRESLGSGTRQVSLMTTARRGTLFGCRHEVDAQVESIAQRPTRAPYWLKLSRHDDVFTAHYSRDGRRWLLIGKTHVFMPDEVLVGIGAVSIREGVLTRTRVDHVQEGRLLGNGFNPEVRLTGGSTEIGPVESMDDTLIRFGAGGTPVATKTVANIRFRPVSQRMAKGIALGRPGIVLSSGEFVAGEIRGIRNGYVTLSSVPLGLIHYDLGTDVAAVVLRKPGMIDRSSCRLTTAEGSVWMAASMTIEGEWVILKDTFGIRRVPLYKVVELEWREKAAV